MRGPSPDGTSSGGGGVSDPGLGRRAGRAGRWGSREGWGGTNAATQPRLREAGLGAEAGG